MRHRGRPFATSPSPTNLEETSENSANVSAGDLDRDGDLDLVLAKGRHTPLVDRVLLNDGEGDGLPRQILGRRQTVLTSRCWPTSMAMVIWMVLTSNDTPDRKVVYLNDGKAGFRVAGTWGAPEWSTRNAAVADLNGDRRPDVSSQTGPAPAMCA